MSVLLTPFVLQFCDNNGVPLAGGFVYTYAAGTTTPKATYTDFSQTVQAPNPIVLDGGGRATIWIDGSYKFVLQDALNNTISTTDNVTSFTANVAGSANAFFQSFSGNASTTLFTLSQNLGTDPNSVLIFVDQGGGKGYDAQNPNAYTLNGTSLTFGSAPASGTNNVYVFAPSLYLNAAQASAAAANVSATAAANSATTASTASTAAAASAAAAQSAAGAAVGFPIATASGTDTITATYSPALALNNLTMCAFIAAGANTSTTPTFSPNGLTAHTITKNGGQALAAGDIPGANAVCYIEYNSANTRWELANPAAPAASSGSFKNFVIGGDFTKNPWQRGTTFTSLATASYSADRFLWTFVGAGVVDFLKTADAPTIPQAGLFTQHCLQVNCTTIDSSIASTDTYSVRHKVEGLNASQLGFGQTGAKSVTLTFWHKHTKTGTFCVAIKNSAANRSYVAEYTQTTTNTWEFATITIPGDTTGTWLYDTGVGLDLHFTLSAGSNFQATANTWSAGSFHATANQVNGLDSTSNIFKLALIQLEVGAAASSFESLPEDVILQRCLRYYWRTTSGGAANFFAHGIGQSTAAAQVQGIYPVSQRSKPTLETTGTASDYQMVLGNSSVTCNSVPTLDSASTATAFCVNCGTASGMADKGPVILSSTGASKYLGFNAEL